MKYIFKSNYSNPTVMELTVAGLVRAGSLCPPGLDPPAGAATPPAVPHRVFPQLALRSQLGKLPGRTLTVASPHIKSPFLGRFSRGRQFLIILC